MGAHEDRWARAQRNLDRAVGDTRVTARIHDIVGHHCSVTFERNGQRFTARNVNVTSFDDEPSPNLMQLVGDATAALGLA
jgi:hypothetical protein